VKRLFRVFACRGEDHPDHRLAGLDHGHRTARGIYTG
jgi:hypothetical protein